MAIDQHDDKKIYCKMLGHHLTFAYCRQGASAQPCQKIFDCWFQMFDVEKFMTEHFTQEQLKSFLAPPKSKTTSLIELIRQAQDNAKTTNPEQ